LRAAAALSPAILVLLLTLVISFVSGAPHGMFLTNSTRGILSRFAIATLVLVLPLWSMSGFLDLTEKIVRRYSWIGQLVKPETASNQELNAFTAWVVRPIQGISLSLIVAERFLSFLEGSISSPLAAVLLRLSLFVIGGALTSVFLSIIWALDDLGVRIYSVKTGEVRMAGSSVGTILPLITGAFGVSALLHTSLPSDALLDLLEIVAVLYPPYILFTVFHNEFVKRKKLHLARKLVLKQIETKVR
jgi:hypothetical protein